MSFTKERTLTSNRLIDPMGLIGDPVMEIGRYISKEYTDAPAQAYMDDIRFAEAVLTGTDTDSPG